MNARILDRRSYKICRLRIQERKTFGEIAGIFNLTTDRVEQIYRAAVRRIDLRQRGRTDSAQNCLSVRALHALDKTFNTTEVTRPEVLQALRRQRLHPYVTKNYGWKTHHEICQWAGLFADQPGVSFSREKKHPDDWATGADSPTRAQLSYLKKLSEKTRESIETKLTKAQASKRIKELQKQLSARD